MAAGRRMSFAATDEIGVLEDKETIDRRFRTSRMRAAALAATAHEAHVLIDGDQPVAESKNTCGNLPN